MSDFKYNLGTSTNPPDGAAYVRNKTVYVTFENKDGLDLTDFFEYWVDDASMRVPADVKITITPVSGAPVSKIFQVNSIIASGSSYVKLDTKEDMDDLFSPVSTLEGTVDFEFGLKLRPKEKPCGGYEEMIVTKEDSPLCVNSCTFKNTVSGREFVFNNIDLGAYDFRFEGPNERYEIIWGPPQGCDPNRIGILNRVEGKKLKLEDYGNSPNAEDINFVDLMIEVKYGSYEWAGGDTDTVYYITANNGTLCAPGEICIGGECVEDGVGSVDYDDIMLLHDPQPDEMYKVRAGDYMIRNQSNHLIPVTRGSTTYQTKPLSCGLIEDTDAIPIHRPSDGVTYQLTGEQFKSEFCYTRARLPVLNNVRLYNKASNVGIEGETFVLEIDAQDNSDDTEYEVVARVIGKGSGAISPVASLFLLPTRSFRVWEQGGDYSSSRYCPVIGDYWWFTEVNADVSGTWSQGGASIVVGKIGIPRGRKSYFNGDQGSASAGITNISVLSVSGTIDYSKPFTRTIDLRTNQGNVVHTDYIVSHVNGPYTFSTTFASTENLGMWERQNHSTDPYAYADRVDTNEYNDNSLISPYGTFWTIQNVDLATKTISGGWNQGVSGGIGGSTNEEIYSQAKNAIALNLASGKKMRFESKVIAGTSNNYIDITPGGSMDKISNKATLSNIGGTSKYEWTMAADVTLEGADVDSALDQAELIVSVVAKNRAGYSNTVQSNYLLIKQ